MAPAAPMRAIAAEARKRYYQEPQSCAFHPQRAGVLRHLHKHVRVALCEPCSREVQLKCVTEIEHEVSAKIDALQGR